jgi:protoporphyrinogen/coproporphyrinogen III oxidase
MPKVVIVGGGISGLALAFRLEQRAPDVEVTVLEQQSHVGGKIATETHDGFRMEAGPNGFLDNKDATLNLCGDLGLRERLVAASEAARRNRFLLLDGRLRKLPTGLWSFVRSDALSWRAKLSLLAERFRPRGPDRSDESIDAFARRRVGREVAETLADPFVTGIFAGDPRTLSVRAAFPRLAALEREHGSVLGGMAKTAKQRRVEAAARGEAPKRASQTWSFREGMGLLIETLRERLRRQPVVGVTARQVRGIVPDGPDAWEVRGEGQDRWLADAVVLTCPAYQQAALLADQDAELAEQIGQIPYNRVAVVAVGFRAADVPAPLDGFGYLVPHKEGREVLGVQWCSSIFPERAPSGAVLLRAMCGGWHRPEMVGWDEGCLLATVRADLGQALGIQAEPIFQRVIRWDRAIPQYQLGHLERVSWIEERAARHRGLFLGGNCYRGVALNDCVERANELADRVIRGVGCSLVSENSNS